MARPEDLTIPDELDTETSPNGDEAEHEPAVGSIAARIRERREELAKKQTLVLKIPGYNGELAVRYHSIPSKEIERFARNVDQKTEQVKLAADMVIRGTDALLARGEDGKLDEWQADPSNIKPNDDPGPLTFDYRLARELGLDEQTKARDLVLAVFSPGGDFDLAVNSHANALIAWASGKENEIDGGLLDF